MTRAPSLKSVMVWMTYYMVTLVKTDPQVVSSSSVILLSELLSYCFTPPGLKLISYLN